ncbi:FG-GAP-like repeat-containing protein [Streptomyces ipomoeae]|uniref:FG-GAP-like repeat-containing protein n=1 Tax=Streptomyces ipomoeae TaxID=103232 RepID=UPI0029AF0356|nr:FG-GAP-like repeat-containing protein [Streptomyces ipomoeae]MDX2822827.1 FG-GAP-like repeat-containing protein [Streptomyces ipomoeae]MDX2879283.1 FG-GAP-like repeat-containing protein [Streptomyces ipomoeae]
MSRRTVASSRTVASCAAVAAALLAVPLVAAAPATAAPKAPIADFNGDGFADLVINAPSATVAGVESAGYVSIVYGSTAGADTAHPQVVSRTTSWLPESTKSGNYFGWSTTARDLDGDGYTDLAVGGFGDSDVVLWGSASGLTSATALPGKVNRAVGADFNGDGKGDLVTTGDGGVQIKLGPFTRAGVAAGTTTLAIDEEDEVWGITVGDMNGDGKDDLITTGGFEEMSYQAQWRKGTSTGVSQTARSTGYYTLGGVIADVNKDGYGDYVARDVGHVSEVMNSEAGNVRVVYGSANGPSTRTTKITQDTKGVPGVSEAENPSSDLNGDQFGYSVAAGDVTGDGYPDIAVGVPGEDIGSIKDAGSVVLLKGGSSGLTGTGAQAFDQSDSGVPGASEAGDTFGASVSLLDVNANNRADLAVGAPGEDGTYENSGAAWLFRGSKNGLVTTNITSFGPAVLKAPENGARFGTGFAS